MVGLWNIKNPHTVTIHFQSKQILCSHETAWSNLKFVVLQKTHPVVFLPFLKYLDASISSEIIQNNVFIAQHFVQRAHEVLRMNFQIWPFRSLFRLNCLLQDKRNARDYGLIIQNFHLKCAPGPSSFGPVQVQLVEVGPKQNFDEYSEKDYICIKQPPV